MRQVIMWSLIFLVLFIVFIGLAFVGLTLMTPSPEELEMAQRAVESRQNADNNASSNEFSLGYPDSSANMKPKFSKIDTLQSKVQELTSSLFFTRIIVDSLNDQLTLKNDHIQTQGDQLENLEKTITNLKDKSVSIKDLAKTYETMKVADMRPILEKVDDATILLLYKNMGSRTKKNLIGALSNTRAAQITKKLAGS